MKKWILLFSVLAGWAGDSIAGDALDREVYHHDFVYSKGTVSITVRCTWDNVYCKLSSWFSASSLPDLENKVGLLQERDGIEDAINHLIAMHIDPHESLRGLATKGVSNPEAREMLALAAVRSKEWRHLMATYQTSHPEFDKLHPLFGKLLLSSGAYDPLNALLAKYGLRVEFFGVEKVMNEKFCKLHLHAPGVNSNDKIRVPIDGGITLGIVPIDSKNSRLRP